MVKSKDLKIMRKKIEKAEKLPNPLVTISTAPLRLLPPSTHLPFSWPGDLAKKESENPHLWDLQAMHSSALTDVMVQDLMRIFEENMAELYRASSWGLDLAAKEAELRHRKARFLLLWSRSSGRSSDSTSGTSSKSDPSPAPEMAAFVHYRFDFDDDERPECAVLYVFEIQVAQAFQRKSLGRYLMQLVEAVARQTQMSKVMLTVFFQNTHAMQFYTHALGYEVDESSPSQHKEPADYEILCRKL